MNEELQPNQAKPKARRSKARTKSYIDAGAPQAADDFTVASSSETGSKQRDVEATPVQSLGVQFTGTVPGGQTSRWFTHSWPSFWYVVWMIVPTGPVQDQAAQLEWKVQVERQAENLLKYYLEIENLSSADVTIEARYTVLG